VNSIGHTTLQLQLHNIREDEDFLLHHTCTLLHLNGRFSFLHFKFCAGGVGEWTFFIRIGWMDFQLETTAFGLGLIVRIQDNEEMP
jgi:hypothetical protein